MKLTPPEKVTVAGNSDVIGNMTSISSRLLQFSSSRLCVVVDDVGSGRAVTVSPAQEITEHEVNRILSLSGGLTFVAISAERGAALLLPLMTRSSQKGASASDTNRHFTSVEAREGVSTGISAADRAVTLRILGASTPQPRALVKPGHIFPIEAREGGVLVKSSIPEASLDVVTLAGFSDAALYMDLLSEQGELLSAAQSSELAARNDIPLFTISELIRYRLVGERLVTRTAEAVLPTKEAGEMRVIVYRSAIHDVEHIALVKGEICPDHPVLVRVQPENTIADVFGGSHPAQRKLLLNSLRAVGERGSGIVLYLRKPTISESLSSPQAAAGTSDMREYGIGAQILRDLGATKIELLSSTQRVLDGLSSFGLSIVSQHAIPDFSPGIPSTENTPYESVNSREPSKQDV
jgi:3,4-dihydroxy 2-butanone 4-phosphate synthase/GTP cyclohydrolase II